MALNERIPLLGAGVNPAIYSNPNDEVDKSHKERSDEPDEAQSNIHAVSAANFLTQLSILSADSLHHLRSLTVNTAERIKRRRWSLDASVERNTILAVYTFTPNPSLFEGSRIAQEVAMMQHIYVYFDLVCSHIFLALQILLFVVWWVPWSYKISVFLNYVRGALYTTYVLFGVLFLETSWDAIISIFLYAVGEFLFVTNFVMVGCGCFVLGSSLLAWLSPRKFSCKNVLLWGSMFFMAGWSLFGMAASYSRHALVARSFSSENLVIGYHLVIVGHACVVIARCYFCASSYGNALRFKFLGVKFLNPRFGPPSLPVTCENSLFDHSVSSHNDKVHSFHSFLAMTDTENYRDC